MIFPIDTVIPILEREVSSYDVPVVDLIATQTNDPFKVLVATILSARTKDEVTAAAARRLFARASTAAELATLTVADVEQLIYPVGFFRTKAKHLGELPGALQRFGGVVPDDIDSLVQLPGVGRKTANLVVAVAFHKPAICVDTHVHRIMNIWGYVQTTTPLQTEMVLRQKLPRQYWIRINGLLVAFGQGTCKPQRPHCDRCVIAAYCPRLGVTPRKKQQGGTVRQGRDERKLISWNVNGLRAVAKNGFLDVLHELDADILALQEIKAHPDQLDDQLRNVSGYQSFWHSAKKKGYAGTAVFSKIPPLRVLYGMEQPQFDDEGRVLTLEYPDFYLINTYSPNAQPELKRLAFKQEFNRTLLAYMDRLRSEKTVVLCGDLNVAHKEIDLANPKANVKNPGFSEQERAWMDELIAAGYVDTFRQFNQEAGQYTWWSYRFNARAKNIGWRIDYFIVDGSSRDRVLEAAIHGEITGSDHCPVSLLFR
ncbi:exodeoxyribonuclease III Xth [Desulfobulbus propionicus DSM 2032]|uniref:Exodeoxyribonuclease III Xth n=1 Tax=Desulfobulbus propionicus (strain ATCC 33891 / DSM 2032 / VKM B-1956 / 1pr3) TaxID=577650 RepID=A0A7U3YNS6_DESPD|nr:exodeoxyribonuclease III [Desulfobulbus propionicus]ADW18775.1 exodeoxyribonuclease III Xth [Desulfobulbus propionicus DSM 2032]